MEGVGARLGRSSSRYGTTTIFTGPVRKWKKEWVHIAPRSNHQNAVANRQISSLSGNGRSNASSRLLLYRWTPISKANKADGDSKSPNSEEDDPDSAPVASEEPPRKKLRYVPVAALEEQQKDAEENNDDDTDANGTEPTPKSDDLNEKPDINDVPVEENSDSEKERQDLNKSTLDLSLGLTSQEGGEQGSDLNMEPANDEDD